MRPLACLDCGQSTRNGSRCQRCTHRREQARGTSTQHGYGFSLVPNPKMPSYRITRRAAPAVRGPLIPAERTGCVW
jgi:hypothetical protein